MSLACPKCESVNYEAFGRPAAQFSTAVYRRHKCLRCGHIFLSRQCVIGEEEADTILATTFSDGTPSNGWPEGPAAA